MPAGGRSVQWEAAAPERAVSAQQHTQACRTKLEGALQPLLPPHLASEEAARLQLEQAVHDFVQRRRDACRGGDEHQVT